jgi:diguanylate cyclase (GGDEF)-like protein/PAS domain S-box-containing protein
MSHASVLIVEDERIVAQHIKTQLTRLGYTVSGIAASGRQALDAAAAQRPDVILMDVAIEGPMDGIETAGRLPPDAAPPVIYLTAYAEEATLARARATTPYGYLLKPFTERELHATIQMTLERRSVEQALAKSERRLALALDAAEMSTWELDPATDVLLRQGLTDCLLGVEPQAFSATWGALLDLVSAADRPAVAAAFDDGASPRRDLVRVEFRRAPEGTEDAPRWLRMQGKAFGGSADGPARVIGVVQDITEHKRAEERLRQAATVLEDSQNGILILDTALRVITANSACQDITGYSLDALAGRPPLFLAPPAKTAGPAAPEAAPDILDDLRVLLDSHGRWGGELWGYARDGRRIPLLMTLSGVSDATARRTHYVAIFSDLGAVKRAEEQIQHLAYYDALTDLPNRRLAMDRLEHALRRCDTAVDKVGLIAIDLDSFKRINDTLGHAVGDRVLRAAAQRMHGRLRHEDTFACMGGDEFLAVIEGVPHISALAATARDLLAAAAQPMEVDGRRLVVTASAGIGVYPADGRTCSDLARAAGTALSMAKQGGGGGSAFYTPEMTVRAMTMMTLEQELRRGLENGELVLHYQPQTAVIDDAVIGFEALVRWQHPDRGLLGADFVVPVAERSGLIDEVGQWVLEEACRQMAEWRDQGLRLPRLSVNASVHQMRRAHLLDSIDRTLRRNALSPRLLEIEITESALQQSDDCLATLHGLRDIGVSRALDDFGTGYSCLGSLKSLPIDRLKIDQGFVRGVPDDPGDAAIVETVIAMAHRLNLKVTAEGVETPAQKRFLATHRCDEIQGFLFGRPAPPSALTTSLLQP